MKSERHAAVRAVARFATIAAQQRSGKSAPVQKQNRLLAFLEASGHRRSQFVGENRQPFLFSSFLPQIDNANQRHLAVVHPLGQANELILLARGVEIAFQRWRGGAEDDGAFLDIRAYDCDIARVIARRFLLLIRIFVFFIDDD